jgi:hypothetical protein
MLHNAFGVFSTFSKRMMPFEFRPVFVGSSTLPAPMASIHPPIIAVMKGLKGV